MPDVFSKRKRSDIMSRVKGSGNAATEVRFLRLLRAERLTGWRRNYPLIGKPDFVFPEQKLSIFIDGCFWHGCPIHAQTPESNQVFWQRKLRKNRERDRLVRRVLKA